jgi:hypothetical protein
MEKPEADPAFPSCGSERVAWIFYGLPLSMERLQPDLDAGRVILSGCSCSGNDPQWKCQACGIEWGRPADLDELYRLIQAAEAAPKSLARRIRGWLGLSLEDGTLLGGLARRLIYAIAGVGVVVAIGLPAPPWVGLTILVFWFLPLLWHCALCHVVALLGLGLVGLAGIRALNWRLIGFMAATLLEMCVLVSTMALLGGWLL